MHAPSASDRDRPLRHCDREAVAFGVELTAEQGAEATFVHVTPAVDVLPAMNMGFGVPAFHMAFGLAGALPHEANMHDRALLEEAAAVAAEQGVSAKSETAGRRHRR